MLWTKLNESTRTVLYCVTVLGVLIAGLIYVAQMNTAEASPPAKNAVRSTPTTVVIPAATFPANAGSLGQIPDSPAGGTICGDYSGAPLNVTFTVSGMTAPLTDVQVSFTSAGLAHSWVADLDVSLRAPSDAAVKTIFKQTGATTVDGCGDDSNVTGPYNFFDTAPASPTWWGAATTAGSTAAVAPGNYQATTPGGAAGGGVVTPITPTFAGLSTAQINGTWTLRVHDGGQGDTGAISAATLTLTGGTVTAPGDGPNDYDGDGKTDYVVVRNLGVGPTGQLRWFYNLNGTATTIAKDFGLGSDFALSGDIDNDDKDDIIVWRPGASGVATYYGLRSSDFAAAIIPFGQTGDDPTVIGDYNGDGITDWAVYRDGASAGQQSTWFWRSATDMAGTINYVPWGQNGDIAIPGDYDGDNRYDYVIQRNNGAGGAAFWRNLSTDADDIINWGLPTDIAVPGDYDGDGKDDLAIVRNNGGALQWWYEPSGTAGIQALSFVFGLFTDFTVQGDFDGDGKTDAAIWRPSATPGASAFWTRSTTSGAVVSVPFGQNGDFPAGNFNTH